MLDYEEEKRSKERGNRVKTRFVLRQERHFAFV